MRADSVLGMGGQDNRSLVLCERRYPDNVIGHYRSLRMRALLPYCNEVARDYMMLLDYESGEQGEGRVTDYRAFPFAFRWHHNEQESEYIPDLILVSGGRATLVHCDPYPAWRTYEETVGLSLATVWCMEHGCELEVVTPELLYTTPYARNIRLLRGFAQCNILPTEVDAVHNYLDAAGQALPIISVARDVGGADLVYGTAVVLYMAYHHMLALPLHTKEIAPSTLVSLPGSGVPEVPDST